jgi:hypothetical protein
MQLSGVTAKGTASHTVLRAPAKGCPQFSVVGTFGLADYLPMLHSAALDSTGQRLFVTLDR